MGKATNNRGGSRADGAASPLFRGPKAEVYKTVFGLVQQILEAMGVGDAEPGVILVVTKPGAPGEPLCSLGLSSMDSAGASFALMVDGVKAYLERCVAEGSLDVTDLIALTMSMRSESMRLDADLVKAMKGLLKGGNRE